MNSDFFVMLHTQRGGIAPMVGDDEEIMTFETADEAKECAEQNLLGAHFGFEVFERGCGV